MAPKASESQPTRWLVENGPKELELQFRAIVYQASAPILIADNERQYRDASSGAGKLLGLPREQIIGRRLDDFADPAFRPQISRLWRTFLEQGEQEGTLRLVGPDGRPRDVGYKAKGNVLPVRHLLALRDRTSPALTEDPHSVLGGGLCAFFVGCGRPCGRLVFGSGAHIQLRRRRDDWSSCFFSLSQR